jgi:hypothetical protein
MSRLRATIAVCEHALLELQHVGRRQVMRNQDKRDVDRVVQQQILLRLATRRGWGDRRRHALHVAQDALNDLFEVRLALTQVLVLHLVELPGNDLQLRRQRPFGVVEPIGDPVLDAAGQCLVLQQHQVHVQHGRQLVRRVVRSHLRDAHLQPMQLVDHRVAPGAQAIDLGRNVVGFDEIVGHIDPAGRHQHGAADRDTARHRQAVHRERHGSAAPQSARR